MHIIYRHTLTQWQVLNCDRRLAPSHPEPFIPPIARRADSLRSSLYNAILHSEDHFQLPWAIQVLRFKIDEELTTHNFGKSDGVCGVVHVLHLKSRTAAVLKVGCSSYPGLFGTRGTLNRYKKTLRQCLWKRLRQFLCIRPHGEHWRWRQNFINNYEQSLEMWAHIMSQAANYTKSSTWKQSWDFYMKLNRNLPNLPARKWPADRHMAAYDNIRKRLPRK